MEFSHDLALELLQSEEEFSVDFDRAWQWIGYSSKQAAKKKLSRNFEEGVDYLSRWMNVPHGKGSSASRSEEIKLTVDAFKSLGMMAGTEKGKEIRRYFLECERQLREQQSDRLPPNEDPLVFQARMHLEAMIRLSEMEKRQRTVESTIAEIKQAQATAHQELIALPAGAEVPPETVDAKVRRVVNNYCTANCLQQSDVFRNLYQQFYYRYRKQVVPVGRESKLQAFVRLGLIDSLYDLAIEICANRA